MVLRGLIMNVSLAGLDHGQQTAIERVATLLIDCLLFYASLRYSLINEGDAVRVFKRKPFARFQRRERITDKVLAEAVRDIGKGRIDADLGGGLIKQRVARPGQGKSGGFRTIIAFRAGERAVFLYGFAKSDQENIDDDETEDLRKQGRAWLGLGDDQIAVAMAEQELKDVLYGEDDE